MHMYTYTHHVSFWS